MKRAALLLMLAAAMSCTKYDPGKFIVGPDDTSAIDAILNLTIDPPSIQADGISTATITVSMSPQSTKKDVVFTATDGTFTVGAQSDAKTARVTADATGKA